MSDAMLLPPIIPETEPFWEGCRVGELRIQRCSETGRYIFPPRPISPWAPAAKPEWVTLSGRGTIWSFVVPHPPLLPFYSARAPYNVILVALDEDPSVRLTGNLVVRAGGEINEIDAATIEIGEKVEVIFDRVSEEVHLPRWVRPQ
jgi:uncharacterized OB-fold protein